MVWLLSHIHIYYTKQGAVKFGLVSSYTASKNLELTMGYGHLPSAEILASRFSS